MKGDEAVQRQYEYIAYPRLPANAILNRPHELFPYAIETPYYLAHGQVFCERQYTILDAGCGTGLRTLALAAANPSAQVIGVDFSSSALKAAEERAQHHNVSNVEFRHLALEEIESIHEQFDYVNCEEVLYMIKEPQLVFSKLTALLKPRGVLRFNCHHIGGREPMLRAQSVFRMLGLMVDNPEEKEAEFVCRFMNALKRGVNLKQRAWDGGYKADSDKMTVLLNHLMVRDKGWDLQEVFSMIQRESLDFVSMVNWPEWDLGRLFENDSLPEWVAPIVGKLSSEQRLCLKSLIDPGIRLLDLWCCPRRNETCDDLASIRHDDCLVHLHPVLQRDRQFKELCVRSIVEHKVLDLTFVEPVHVDPLMASVVLQLFEKPLTIRELTMLDEVKSRYARIERFADVGGITSWLREVLKRLEEPLYLLVGKR